MTHPEQLTSIRFVFQLKICLKQLGAQKQQQKILFISKSLKTYYFGPAGGGGQEPYLPPPDAHALNQIIESDLDS
jgi:hypothetical protein